MHQRPNLIIDDNWFILLKTMGTHVDRIVGKYNESHAGECVTQITARKLHNISCQINQIFIPSLQALFALRGNIIQTLLPCIDSSPSGISKLYGKHPRPGLAVQFKFLFHRSLRGEDLDLLRRVS